MVTGSYFDLNVRATSALAAAPSLSPTSALAAAPSLSASLSPAALAPSAILPAASVAPALTATAAASVPVRRQAESRLAAAAALRPRRAAVKPKATKPRNATKGLGASPSQADAKPIHSPSPKDLQLPDAARPHWKPMSGLDQVVMYLAVVVGVAFSSAVQTFKSGATMSAKLSISSVVLAAIVGLVIIPVVFEKLSIRPDAPFIVRFGLFVQTGVFWQVIISSIGKTFT